ncbi:hypothetical protein BJX61DRAFT_240891 [Aspergillus egyptiacus]|nr:hypothetical protein BJX61DRAFT_240891 [Aspergillus egyptiacus]
MHTPSRALTNASNKMCFCAEPYFVVEGLQTERPRLVRSGGQQYPNPSSRAPLPMQIRPQSRGGCVRRERQAGDSDQAREQQQNYAYGSVRSRPHYSRYPLQGILKPPTEEFPFDDHCCRQPQEIQRSKNVRVEVGRSSTSPGLPASDVVKIRVYRQRGTTSQHRCGGVVTEKVEFRAGDIVVRHVRPEAGTLRRPEPLW